MSEYWIEVGHLPSRQMDDLLIAAGDAGLRAEIIHNGWAVGIYGLSEAHSVALREELRKMGIHASIGIAAHERAS